MGRDPAKAPLTPNDALLSTDEIGKTPIPTRETVVRTDGTEDNFPKDPPMSARYVATSRQFFTLMQTLAQRQNSGDHHQRYYFRGESDPRYTLLPSLLRDGTYNRLAHLHNIKDPIELQKKLLDRYRRYTQHLIHADNDFSAPIWADFDTLCLAQHHGLPTLLMDWTLNPYVAAYFAVSGAYGRSLRQRLAASPKITKYWIRVWVMRLCPLSERELITVHLEDRKKTWDELLGQAKTHMPSVPFVVVPLVFTRRIAAQAGRFIYCGYMAAQGAGPYDSLARFSAAHKNDRDPKNPRKDGDLAWDQLFSVDVEFDIGNYASASKDPPEDVTELAKYVDAKLDVFRQKLMETMSELEFIGFHAGRLFPDLSGWAQYLAEGNV
jgi:hypothetical protein